MYPTDTDRERYRVHDAAFGRPMSRPHHRRVVALGSPKANHRYFVPEFGVPRVYRFARGESRKLARERLAKQLRGAGFVATTRWNVSAKKPK